MWKWNNQAVLKITLLVALGGLILYIYIARTPGRSDIEVQDVERIWPEPNETKLILFADFPFYYGLEKQQGEDGMKQCTKLSPSGEMMKCELTIDKGRFLEADAVLFNSHYKTKMEHLGFKPVKRRGTTWTFFAVESPLNAGNQLFNDQAFHNKFNSTMTYRKDSDFWLAYTHTERRKVPMSPEERQAEEVELRKLFRRKNKMAAIFVSNCKDHSKRLEYVLELKKHIQVDVYGACGDLVCARSNETACDEMIKRDYKFYLAFENSHCLDYVTEKLWRVLGSRRAVPVVRGGADYSNLFPKNSVINAANFPSPSHLASHLKTIAADEEKYMEMFKWSSHWVVKGPDYLPLCEYCHHLFSQERSSHLYPNVYDWWSNRACHRISAL